MHEEVIGTGYTADVIAWGEDKVLKLFHEGFPAEVIEMEFSNAKFLNGLDFAKPEAHALVHHQARRGIVYGRIYGESLLDWVIRTRDVKRCAAGARRISRLMLRPSLCWDVEGRIRFPFFIQSCYEWERLSMSKEEAMKELRTHAGIQFDPDLAQIFLDQLEKDIL